MSYWLHGEKYNDMKKLGKGGKFDCTWRERNQFGEKSVVKNMNVMDNHCPCTN